MLPSVQSIFLQSLGHAIANSLWQMAGIWLLFMALDTLFHFNAAVKYRLAVIAQFTGLAWFLMDFVRGYLPATVSSASVAAAYTGLSVLPGKTAQFLPYLSLLYLVMMSLMAIRWIAGYRHTRMIETQGLHKMPAEWRLFIKRIASQLAIRKEVRIFLSEHITTPLTTGFLKPVILVPLASINHLTTAQLEAVLLHEMAHIKRHDYLLNMILSIIELVLFFNPFTRLIAKEINKERENSCDDWVLQFRYDASEYAHALLRIASLQAAPSFAMAAAGRKTELLFRVKRMIGQEKRSNQRKQLFIFLLAGTLLFMAAWIFPKNDAAIKKARLTDVTAAVTPQKPLLVVVRQEPPVQINVLPAVIVSTSKKMALPEIESNTEQMIPAEQAPLAQPLILSQATNVGITGELPPPANPVMLNEDPDKVMASLNNIDLEKLLTDVFQSARLSEGDKKEFARIRDLFLSDRNRELIKNEMNEKQRSRLQSDNFTSVRYSTDQDPQQPTTQLHTTTTPLVIKVSFTMADPDDARQVARIKLAILNQLRLVLQNKNKREKGLNIDYRTRSFE